MIEHVLLKGFDYVRCPASLAVSRSAIWTARVELVKRYAEAQRAAARSNREPLGTYEAQCGRSSGTKLADVQQKGLIREPTTRRPRGQCPI
jgi:hypothetical protein